MSRAHIAIVVALSLAAGGCGRSDDTAKVTAKRLFEAYREGDTGGILEHIRLGEWEEGSWEAENKTFAANRAFRHQVLSAIVEGDEATVALKVKEEKDAEWAKREIHFRKIDGKWKTTLDEFTQASGAIILTCPDRGAEAAAKRILEGLKKGDPEPMLDHLDLKGMYEEMVPEQAREEMSYEKFEKEARKGMKAGFVPAEGFDYEILGSEKKGDQVIVKVKVKETKDAEWEEQEVPFEKIEGKWKITMEGLQKLAEED